MKTITIIVILAIFGLVTFFLWGRAKMKNIPVVEDTDNILTLTDKNFSHQTKDKVVLVDFWAEWCAPCRMMAPVLNEVAGKLSGDAAVGKVNIEEYQMLAQKYQIRNIPTMILFSDGKEINRYVGMKSKDFLLEQINKAK